MTEARKPESAPLTRNDLFSFLGGLGALLTLGTAVMFYFGWRRSEVQAQAMEMDVSLFGFSTQDYVLRGLTSLYAPALVLAVLTMGLLGLHRMVVHSLDSPRLQGERRARTATSLRWTAIAAAVIATACVLFTWEGTAARPRRPVPEISRWIDGWRWTVPALLVAATLLAVYAWLTYRRLTPGRPRPPVWSTVVSIVVVVSIVALGLFWVLEDYAATIGRRNARLIEQGTAAMPRATVISPRELHIRADGVTETPIQGGSFMTTGLRLLARSGGKVVLLHDGWNPQSGTVIVVSDSDELVWQFER